MASPNAQLRAARQALRMSQADLAKAVQEAGARAGEPNGCTASQVRRWESGSTALPHPRYLKALEMVTGQPAENLGFRANERYGLDTSVLGMRGEGAWLPEDEPRSAAAPLSGIWLSRYGYVSSGRGNQEFANSHYVVLLQRGAKLQVRSLPDTTPGRVVMDLIVNGQVVTGTWTEETNPSGYYQGAVYHGAIQMLLDPTGRKMSGKWAGFGRDFDVNTGPWSLELVTRDTDSRAMEEYNRPVVDKTPDGDDQQANDSQEHAEVIRAEDDQNQGL